MELGLTPTGEIISIRRVDKKIHIIPCDFSDNIVLATKHRRSNQHRPFEKSEIYLVLDENSFPKVICSKSVSKSLTHQMNGVTEGTAHRISSVELLRVV